ncbi:P-loop containing nucleoside triphosphate hydrolase protein [Phyllosticta citriasiana]|uniref:P-loop containing nucleoside triphosphate hydrolase protein n=1 Tax=Phyllosticta citriasiana TaxID=595635 RepID=A0ABR1KU24_9PEZI
MMRQKPSVAMQKTYDDCYLICSTAVYFETQGNEAEALRSWRSALDNIYYFNAYRRPAAWTPKTETDKALQASLQELELQCKERVDLLEALSQSRKDGKKDGDPATASGLDSLLARVSPKPDTSRETTGWLGDGSVPASNYSDVARPALPKRPSMPVSWGRSSEGKVPGLSPVNGISIPSPPVLPLPSSLMKPSRTPSPDKKKGGMLKTLRPNKDGRKSSSSSAGPSKLTSRPPAAAKAATQAWESIAGANQSQLFLEHCTSKEAFPGSSAERFAKPSSEEPRRLQKSWSPPESHSTYIRPADEEFSSLQSSQERTPTGGNGQKTGNFDIPERKKPPTPPPHRRLHRPLSSSHESELDLCRKPLPAFPSYRSEYLPPERKNVPIRGTKSPRIRPDRARKVAGGAKTCTRAEPSEGIKRRTTRDRPGVRKASASKTSMTSEDESTSTSSDSKEQRQESKADGSSALLARGTDQVSEDSGGEEDESTPEGQAWKESMDRVLKQLPKGVDAAAAKQIFNEIVIQGDEVHWDDVAGLESAKSALKETVVYPFLRPDLFMGLREPARGMLLFGPPGTGKTMLARAVATESKSTFFAISASSLTSKYLGDSEKLVRALFQLSRVLAPSIIFVDEIDSLLSSRSSSSEQEATRRIKTEFLIQWSNLAKAAAGREQSEREREKGDASRVLVLAATNLPWAIDEAARRRFVRRQYIPLPEDHVRKAQLQTLLSHQKHSIGEDELDRLVVLSEGFSGSDITALAKDAAMGPLRSLGEKLLHMTMEEIRPIQFEDFEASLNSIRPSVSKQGLKQFEDWAKDFGERGG